MRKQVRAAGHALGQVGVERERKPISTRRTMQRGEAGVERESRSVEYLPDLQLVGIGGRHRSGPGATWHDGRTHIERRRRIRSRGGPPRLAPVSLVDHPAVEDRDALAVGQRAFDGARLGTLGCRRAEDACNHL